MNKEHLPQLERLSKSLDLSPENWTHAMKICSEYGAKFLSQLDTKPAYQPHHLLPHGRLNPPESPETLNQVLNDFSELALHSGIEPTSGRFFGYIPGGGMPASAIGDLIAALTNRYSGVHGASPGAVEIENQVVRWIRKLLDWPQTSWGTLQSGGSLASLTAIIAARSTRPPEQWSKSVIYCSEESHHCFQKAVAIAGLESSPFRKISTDSRGRLSITALKQQIKLDINAGFSPWILCATAGTTNLGAIDPIEECSEICRQENIWLHVDAAYGGFFWLTQTGKSKLKGMELGDSIILDPHKGLFQPYGIGIVIVREGSLLKRSLAQNAAYLQDLSLGTVNSPTDYSPELTRHFRGLRLWFALKLHGMEAFRAALDEKLILAHYLHEKLSKFPELSLFCEPDLSVVAFRCRGDSTVEANSQTQRWLDRILTRGRIHISSTTIHGFQYLRLCILSFRTHLNEVNEAIAEIASLTN